MTINTVTIFFIILAITVPLVGILPLAIMVLDHYGRGREKKLHLAVKRYVKQKGLIDLDKYYRLFRHSACQRETLIQVFGEEAKKYYKRLGYTRLSIFPDAVYTPKILVSIRFWYVFAGLAVPRIADKYGVKL